MDYIIINIIFLTLLIYIILFKYNYIKKLFFYLSISFLIFMMIYNITYKKNDIKKQADTFYHLFFNKEYKDSIKKLNKINYLNENNFRLSDYNYIKNNKNFNYFSETNFKNKETYIYGEIESLTYKVVPGTLTNDYVLKFKNCNEIFIVNLDDFLVYNINKSETCIFKVQSYNKDLKLIKGNLIKTNITLEDDINNIKNN